MKTAFFDVDTQLDFLYPAGALAVPGGGGLVSGLADLTRFAAAKKIVLLSTVDAHAENDPEFQHWPPHCIAGTIGQNKPSVTVLPQSVVVSNGGIPDDRLRTCAGAPQVIVQKQTIDPFTNVSLRFLLDAIGAERFIVYGVAAEVCVEKALFGLLQTGVRVECVSDGIRAISEPAMRNMLAHFQAAGGKLATIGQVTA